MRILFICTMAPPVGTGGHQRLSHLLKAVSGVGKVTLVYPASESGSSPDLEALRPLCTHVFTFPEGSLAKQRELSLPRPIGWALHKLRYLHPTLPALLQRYRSVEGKALVTELCAQRFDLVWVQRIVSTQLLPKNLTTRVIVDLDDLEHHRLQRQLQHGKIHHMTPLYWLEFLKFRRVEGNLHSLPYEFAVCSAVDQKALGSGGRVWVIPNGADLPSRTSSPHKDEGEPILLFVGSMFYEPNVDAVRFFAREVLPLIQREIPDVRFLIVGKDPAQSVRDLHDGKSVIVTGTVPEVAEYLQNAAVVLAPIRFGGGTRLKILEAMAYRKPVVSTTVGAEGLDVQSGKHLLLADSPKDIAAACLILLKDESLSRRLSEEGFRLVSERYQWAMIEEMVGNIVLGPRAASLNPARQTESSSSVNV